jgi:hypothetical protein
MNFKSVMMLDDFKSVDSTYFCTLCETLGKTRYPMAQSSIEVNVDDQNRINTFSRLNAKMHDLELQVKAKKASK